MAAKIGSLNVDLTLETARFQKGIKETQGSLSKMQAGLGKVGAAIGAAFATGAIISAASKLRDMTRAAVDSVGGLGEQAAALGVNVQALQAYRYAATQVGLTSGEMDKGFEQLTRRLGEAAQGAKEPAEALKRLGLTMDDIKGKRADEVLPLIADGMKGIKSETERAAISVDLFGKAGQKMAALLGEGSAGINKMIEDARKMGIVLTEEEIASADKAADAMAAIDMKVQARMTSLLARNGESLAEFESRWAETKIKLMQTTIEIGDAIGSIETAYEPVYASLHKFGASVRESYAAYVRTAEGIRATAMAIPSYFSAMVDRIRGAVIGRLDAVWDGVKSKIETVKKAFFNLADAVVFNSYIPDMVDGIAAQMQRLDAVMVSPVKQATAAATAAFRKLAADVRPIMERLFPESALRNNYDSDFAKIEQAAKAGGWTNDQRREALDRLQGEYLDKRRDFDPPMTIAGGDGPLVKPAQITPEIAKSLQAMQAAMPTTDTLAEKLGSVQLALGQIGGKFGDLASQIVGSISAAINPAVDSSISKFAQLQTAMQGITSVFQSIFGKKVGGIIGGVLQVGTALLGAFGKVPGRALGGPVTAGMPYIVGERGPELVVPRHNGSVISNSDMRGMGRGGAPVTFDLRGAVMTTDLLAQMNVMAASHANVAVISNNNRMARSQRKRLA